MNPMGFDADRRQRWAAPRIASLAVAVALMAMVAIGAFASVALGRSGSTRTRGQAAAGGDAVRLAHAADLNQQCSEPYSETRDPSNPLALPVAPGANPLTGANFFIPGPAHGAAAGAIAQLLGLDPKRMSATESWSSLDWELTHGRYASELASNPGLAHQVDELAKIAPGPPPIE